jgi:ATP-binding cassette, subfamily B, bacterial PglK
VIVNKIRNALFFLALTKLINILTAEERKVFYRILIMTTFAVFLEMASIILILPVMSLLTGGRTTFRIPGLQPALDYLQTLAPEKALVIEILVLLVVVLIKNAYQAWIAYKQSAFGYSVQARISNQLFENYLSQPFQYHLHQNSATLIRNCTQEPNQVNQFVIMPGFTIISEAFLVLGVAFLLIFLQPYFTLVNGILMGSAFMVFNRLTSRRILSWGYQRLSAESHRIQLIQQSLGAIKDVKLRRSEKFFLSEYTSYNKETSHVGHLQNALQQMPRLFLEVLLYAGLLVLVVLTVVLNSNIGNLVSALGLFAAAVYKVLPSANKISTSYQSMKFSMPSMDNFLQELNLGKELFADQTNEQALTFNSSIAINRITYTYEGGNYPVLSNVSLTIKKGECIGLHGESGSGKSTLINIVLGLLPPQQGSVSVDGIDIATNITSWNKKLGYVPQSIYLIDDSIRRNIAFGLPDDQIDDDAVSAALEKAHLKIFVNSLQEGFNTFVGERGVRLSGGQIQRIGIARALYHNPEVLILDEATSALDYSTESSIMEAIETLYGMKTLLIIAHRLSTLEKCDRLYKLDKGNLILEYDKKN